MVCAVGAIGGALLVLQPPVLGFPAAEGDGELQQMESGVRFYIGAAILIFGLTLFAIGTVLMKILSTKCEMNWAIPAVMQSTWYLNNQLPFTFPTCLLQTANYIFFSGAIVTIIGLTISGDILAIFHVCALKSKMVLCAISCLSLALHSSVFYWLANLFCIQSAVSCC